MKNKKEMVIAFTGNFSVVDLAKSKKFESIDGSDGSLYVDGKYLATLKQLSRELNDKFNSELVY